MFISVCSTKLSLILRGGHGKLNSLVDADIEYILTLYTHSGSEIFLYAKYCHTRNINHIDYIWIFQNTFVLYRTSYKLLAKHEVRNIKVVYRFLDRVWAYLFIKV